MKAKNLFWLPAIVLVFALTIITCDNGGGGGGGGNYSGKPGGQQPVDPLKETYVSYDVDGNEYKLEITEATAAMFRALDQNKDYIYTLTIKFTDGKVAISTGTVEINIDTDSGAIVSIGLKHTGGTTITVTVSGSENSDTGGFAIESVTDEDDKPVGNIPVDNDSEVKAVDVPKGSYILNEAGTGYVVLKGVVTNGVTVIPATFLGKPVIEIGWRAFAYNTDLTSVTIPASVTDISGWESFAGCTNLTTVNFAAGSRLQTIGGNAFRDCTSLTSITIPASVTTIGAFDRWAGTFQDCTNLTTVTFAQGSGLQNIGNGMFSGCTSLTSITIPASVISIGNMAFEFCESLTSITIPASVTSIGHSNDEWGGTFSGCTNLTTVTFAQGSRIQNIGNGMFSGCTSLTSITIPASVISIGNMAFQTCESLTSINIPEGVTTIGVRGTS
jgi:flagellar basal body rod protein FlgG